MSLRGSRNFRLTWQSAGKRPYVKSRIKRTVLREKVRTSYPVTKTKDDEA